ncbi:exodeoxyribonuclease VII large subunit [Rothia nasimurium]|uniref:exodeoxyribonuclease VII large subunit n=1 Tax=Rothia nasimurium TaxID=85336 RepID=UPI001F01D67D|nr:exodeoxyribonuclease VII large subunit [Rothia nasimurium]
MNSFGDSAPGHLTLAQLQAQQEQQAQRAPRQLAERAGQTSVDNPWPLHVLSNKMHEYIARCVPTWVEGQIIELNHRGRVSYVTLRDIEQEVSVSVTVWGSEMAKVQGQLERGSRVVLQLKPDFWVKTGRLSMQGSNIKPVGVGSMLELIEQLRARLQAEGLFSPERKKPLPLLPRRVGLITGRDSDAMKDVIRNASLRWPAVDFEVREVAVQGVNAVAQVTSALAELDSRDDIDVIVIARGGGSFEDLLPFSEEAMVRAVAAAHTPVVSAIGHEADSPLMDYAADLRASTPTDAGKRIVPDVREERELFASARYQLQRAVEQLIAAERHGLAQVRSRPVLANPGSALLARAEDLERLRARASSAALHRLARDRDLIGQLRARVTALSPQQTLERGYAVMQDASGQLVRDARTLHEGQNISVRAAAGAVDATVTAVHEKNH